MEIKSHYFYEIFFPSNFTNLVSQKTLFKNWDCDAKVSTKRS